MKKAQFRIIKKGEEKIYLYCILNEHFDWRDENYKATKEEKAKAKKLGLTEYFELYDDDDSKYLSGYMNTDTLYDNNRDEFTILDRYMNDLGCTYMKYRDTKTGKMQHL